MLEVLHPSTSWCIDWCIIAIGYLITPLTMVRSCRSIVDKGNASSLPILVVDPFKLASVWTNSPATFSRLRTNGYTCLSSHCASLPKLGTAAGRAPMFLSSTIAQSRRLWKAQGVSWNNKFRNLVEPWSHIWLETMDCVWCLWLFEFCELHLREFFSAVYALQTLQWYINGLSAFKPKRFAPESATFCLGGMPEKVVSYFCLRPQHFGIHPAYTGSLQHLPCCAVVDVRKHLQIIA